MPAPQPSPSQRAERRVGRVLRDKYRLERVLGVGGMGAVYQGVHRNGNRVAVKVLHAELSLDDDLRARFLREGYVANSLGHPGAVRVLDDDLAEDGSAFLVMELLEGETLEHRLKRHCGRLPPREVLALAHQLLDVLAAAHDRGVVHRDVKPENLFLVRGGQLKVLDFGIARVLDGAGAGATGAGSRLGTPAFMPPEQALGRTAEIDARSDVWAVGATMFTLLSGHFVHDAETAAELIVRTATQPGRPLSTVSPDVPASVAAIVDRALAFAREDRWPSARAMQAAIEEAHTALHGEPLSPTVIAPLLADRRTSTLVSLDTAPGATPAADPGATTELSSAPTTLSNRAGTEVGVTTVAPLSSTAPESLATATESLSTATEGPPAAGPLPLLAPTRAHGVTSRLRPRALLLVALLGALSAGAAIFPRAPRPAASAGSAPAAAPPGCVDDRSCTVPGGPPAICRKDTGVCVTLTSEDCRVLAEPTDLGNDATVWVGAMFPTAGDDAPKFGRPSVNAVDLARRDFAEISGGLPSAHPGGPRRPLAVVACDDRVDAARAARHLVDDLHVPAVVGFARSKEVMDLASSLFVPRGVLMLASNTATMLRTIPHAPGEPRLVWRTTTSSDMIAASRNALVSEVLEPALRAAPGLLGAGEPARVALVRIGNPSGQSLADQFVAGLRFNGRSVLENGEAFRQVVVPDGVSDYIDAAARARVTEELVAFAPHIVVGAGGLDGRLLLAVERAWPAARRPRPRYALDELGDPAIFELIRERPEARGRIFATDTVSSTPAIGKFALRYNEVFSPKITPNTAQSAPYDAFYLLAYAVAALGEEPVTGAALARALPRLLPPGEPIDVGAGGIYAALQALGSGKSIDLGGTITSLDFDGETGDATADFSVNCLGGTGHGDARDILETGLVLDARAHKLRGTLRCP